MAEPHVDGLSSEIDEFRGFVRQAFVTGSAVTLPIILTLIVLGVIVDVVSRQLNPIVGLVVSSTGIEPASEAAIKLASVGALIGTVLVVGAVAERHPDGSDVATIFTTMISRIPGVGSLYRSLDEMSTLLLDSDTDSFREVKLVEFPAQGSYTVAFLTADTPEILEAATDHDPMVTLFIPMAPNPVMGGFVVHVSADRVHDVEMTVEEGIQSIVTSGVATGQRNRDRLSDDMLDRLNRRLSSMAVAPGVNELERLASEASSKLEDRMPDSGGAEPDDGDAGTSDLADR